MEEYILMDWQTLLDLLVKHTSSYTEMLSSRVFDEKEFAQCKLMLANIHSAIKQKAELQGHPMPKVLPNFPGHNEKPADSTQPITPSSDVENIPI